MTVTFRRLTTRRVAGVCGTALVLASCACAGGPPAADLITLDGSSTVFPISEAVAEEFQKVTPGARVTVGISGTGGGFQRFCRSETLISNASRPILASEIAACEAAGVAYVELPVAYDGLAIVVNPRNDWATSITTAELKTIWEPAAQGTILRWNQVRAAWPDQEIHLFGAGVDSGTFDYFTEVINGKAKASRGDYTSSEDDNVLVQGVAGDAYALGFMGLAYYQENRARLRVVPVDDERPENGAGPTAPSLETVRGGTYQPLSRPIFIYVNRQALARPDLQRFADFYLTSVPALAAEVGYVPLADPEQRLVEERLAARTPGTLFDPAAPMHSEISLEARLRGQRP
jgi:phosphate transport system substrate-binding protein